MNRWLVRKNRLDLLDLYCDVLNRLQLEMKLVYNRGGHYFNTPEPWNKEIRDTIWRNARKNILLQMEGD